METSKWVIAVVLTLLAAVAVECALPSVIRIAAVFDDDQDAKHELAFRCVVAKPLLVIFVVI